MGFLHEPAAESWKELKPISLYCMVYNPQFFGTESKLFDGTGS
jgi:hypothetical protein